MCDGRRIPSDPDYTARMVILESRGQVRGVLGCPGISIRLF